MSASATCGWSASGSENAATVPMPRSRQVGKTRRAISPRLATSSLLIMRSHPEDPEAIGSGDRRVVDDGQAEPQDGTGVAGVDDPVVVQPPGQEVRQRLRLDLPFDPLTHPRPLPPSYPLPPAHH